MSSSKIQLALTQPSYLLQNEARIMETEIEDLSANLRKNGSTQLNGLVSSLRRISDIHRQLVRYPTKKEASS